MKKLSSVFLSLVLMLSCFAVPNIVANASYGDTILDKEDYFDTQTNGKYYSFELDEPAYLCVDFESEKELIFGIESKELSYNSDIANLDVFNFYDYYSDGEQWMDSFHETKYFPAGEYRCVLEYENYPKKDIDYSLTITDVTESVTSAKWNKSVYYSDMDDESFLLLNVYPKGSLPEKLKFSSTNKKVAEYSGDSHVRNNGLGETVISATIDNSIVASCQYIVDTDYMVLFDGQTQTLPTVNGKKVKWKSNNKKVATIKGNKVKAVAPGNVSLKCKVNKITYCVKLHVASQEKILSKIKSEIKSKNSNMSNFKITHIWKGVHYDEPIICIQYSCKKANGKTVSKYCYGYSRWIYSKKNKGKTKYYVFDDSKYYTKSFTKVK